MTPGTRYGYRLGVEQARATQWLGEVWLDVPLSPRLVLHGARPNPSGPLLNVAFSIQRSSPVSIDVMDLRGRRVISRSWRGLEPGEHVIDLGVERPIAPGVYWLELTQEGTSLVQRCVVMK